MRTRVNFRRFHPASASREAASAFRENASAKRDFASAKSGDTLVEVAFAIGIFAAVSIIAVNVMNAGLNTAQASLEVTMARNEMDAQAEAIRFIHNAFTLEREEVVEKQQYRNLWYKLTRDSDSVITGTSGMANRAENLPELSVEACSEIYQPGGNKSIINTNTTAFIMNTRIIDPEDATFGSAGDLDKIIIAAKGNNADRFVETPLYPRVLFTNTVNNGTNVSNTNSNEELSETGEYRYVARAEGIWVIAVKDQTKSSSSGIELTPEFFDFHIRTCWYAPGRNRPSTIGTIIRLYNPELVEDI